MQRLVTVPSQKQCHSDEQMGYVACRSNVRSGSFSHSRGSMSVASDSASNALRAVW